jgi:thiol-disulfide isomerase/thioredoxin
MSEKTQKKDRIVTGIITIVIVLLVGFNVFSYYGAAIVLPGKALISVSGVDPQSGKAASIDFSKGTYIVDFWATWCGACVAEMDELNGISKKYPVYGVIKKPFKKEVYNAIPPQFRNVIVEDDLFNEYYISVIPTTILVKDGIISKVRTGGISAAMADEWFKDE